LKYSAIQELFSLIAKKWLQNCWQHRNIEMTELPVAPVKRLIKAAGAERVGSDAGQELAVLMEEYGMVVAREAHKLCMHAGRQTVTAHDIRMAAEILK
jgi:histone H3/H4